MLDILERVRDSGEQGLLSMALPPHGSGTVLSPLFGYLGRHRRLEFTFSGPDRADPASERSCSRSISLLPITTAA